MHNEFTSRKLKKLLKTIIQEMARNRDQFTQSPGKDFSRKRKLDFASVISILLSMSGGSTASSLMDYFKFDPAAASTSAFVQQRAKLKPEAMEYLFQCFVQESPVRKHFMASDFWPWMGLISKSLPILTMRNLIIPARMDNVHTACFI